MHYEQLKAGVIQHDLLVDNLIYKVSSSAATAVCESFTMTKTWIKIQITSFVPRGTIHSVIGC